MSANHLSTGRDCWRHRRARRETTSEAVSLLSGGGSPTDPDGFLGFARSLRFPDIYEAVHAAEPLDDPVPFRFPASVRHRYERLTPFPDGLLVMGDAVCSFNPIYGQGMSVAALEALVLRRHLERGIEPQPHRFFRDIARVVDVPWDIAVVETSSSPASRDGAPSSSGWSRATSPDWTPPPHTTPGSPAPLSGSLVWSRLPSHCCVRCRPSRAAGRPAPGGGYPTLTARTGRPPEQPRHGGRGDMSLSPQRTNSSPTRNCW
jgi:hypothetical protein